jgi:LAO/AO transport system kinase
MTERTRRLAEELLSESSSEERRRSALARAITLVESRAPTHRAQADLLLNHALSHKVSSSNTTTSFRLGIAGPPGAGKSTFIEALGLYILNAPEEKKVCHKLAVACIDPSSTVTGGSILGDKTRMMELSRHERVRILLH